MRPRPTALAIACLAAIALLVLIDLNRHPMLPAEPGSGSTSRAPGPNATASGTAFLPFHDIDSGLRYGTRPTCSFCHYNPQMTFWSTQWHPARSDAGAVTAWNLTVASSVPQTALLTVQAGPRGSAFTQAAQHPAKSPWSVGETWSRPFQVAAGASGIYVQVDATSFDPTGAGQSANTTVGGLDASTGTVHESLSLALKGPDGSLVKADGPRGDRKLIVLAHPAAGPWTMLATLDSATVRGQAVPAASGAASIEVMQGASAGPVVPVLIQSIGGPYGILHGPTSVNFTFPAQPDGSPPAVDLRVRAYTDHRRFYVGALNDLAELTSSLIVRPGPEPGIPAYSAADLDQVWRGQSEYRLHELDNASLGGFYTTNATGGIDTLVAGVPYPTPTPSRLALLPGARTLRFELTWTPPTNLPDVGVRFQPANRPTWFDAQNTGRSTGKATYRVDADPSWWDPLGWDLGGWDMAAYLPLHPNTTYATEVSYTLKMYADR